MSSPLRMLYRSTPLLCGLSLIVTLLCLPSCGSEAPAAKPKDAASADAGSVFSVDTSASADTATSHGDAGTPADTGAAADTTPAADTATDAGESAIVGISLKAEKSALLLAERAALSVVVKRADGSEGPPAKDASLTITVDGLPQSGAGVAPTGAPQPAVAAWQFGGKLQLVGVRPGSAKVVAKLDSVISPPLSITVAWPEKPGIWAAAGDVSGETPAERVADVPATVQLKGKQVGAGGLTTSVRFPLATPAGARLDLGKAPASGSLAVTLSFANLGGATLKPVEGALWLDQTDKGWFRGTFLGRTAQLKPVAGVFVVERKGAFGVDVLDAPVQVAKSDSVWPTTGVHYSRVSLTATGDSKAVLFAREIKDGLKANLVRWQIDAKTGLITPLPAMIANANAYAGTPATKAPAFGEVIRASHGSVVAELWEGRDGKGATKPHRLWVRLLDATGKVLAKATVSDDTCDGSCRPQIALLPSTRFAVMWSPASGGVKIRRIKGQLADGQVAFVQPSPQVISAKGKDGVLATQANNVLAGWFDPDQGPVWRLFLNKSTGKLSASTLAESVGATSTKSPPQVMLAIQTASGAPNLLFSTAWVDYQPAGKLSIRRVALDGSPFGLPTALGPVDADAIWGRTGKDGQVALLQRNGKGVLSVRKVRFATYKEQPSPLGEVVELFGGGGYPVHPAMVYVPEADIWVVAWSGKDESPGVWVRRFR